MRLKTSSLNLKFSVESLKQKKINSKPLSTASHLPDAHVAGCLLLLSTANDDDR